MQESNNDFFSYSGIITRKNYTINMVILAALFIGLTFIRFENLPGFSESKFLYPAVIFMAEFAKFVILMSSLSVIYRRLADISAFKSYNFNLITKRIFVFLFILPVLYLFCIRYFIDIIPPLRNILDMAVIFVLAPLSVIGALVLCFIKGKQ